MPSPRAYSLISKMLPFKGYKSGERYIFLNSPGKYKAGCRYGTMSLEWKSQYRTFKNARLDQIAEKTDQSLIRNVTNVMTSAGWPLGKGCGVSIMSMT